jgi:hypothetical protein
MLAMLKTIWKSMFSPEPKTPAKRDSDGTQWCLVGNIVAGRKCGVGGTETRRGTKHFSAGTKVFCLPAQWGDGYDQIVVIGRHRGSKRFVTMIISSDWVARTRSVKLEKKRRSRTIRHVYETSAIETKRQLTKPCSGMAVVRVLTSILFPRHPLMAVVSTGRQGTVCERSD